MKGGQVIERNMRNTFLQKSCRKSGSGTNSRSLFAFKKGLCELKASGLQLGFNIL